MYYMRGVAVFSLLFTVSTIWIQIGEGLWTMEKECRCWRVAGGAVRQIQIVTAICCMWDWIRDSNPSIKNLCGIIDDVIW
jgi:hypothetical protein